MEAEPIDGLKLFEDLSARRITFGEFLVRFATLPKAEQDRLLGTKPQASVTVKAPSAS